MEFTGGAYREFVVHAYKYSKAEAVQIMTKETGYEENLDLDHMQKRWCRYYVQVPEFCNYDGDGGCYTYCEEGERGVFPVWVI